jgi:hypothetical protein
MDRTGSVALAALLALAAPWSAAGADGEVPGERTLREELARARDLRERILALASAASYAQHGFVRYVHFQPRQLRQAMGSAREYRATVDRLLRIPVEPFLKLRKAIHEVAACRKWGETTALVVEHPFDRARFEVVIPIVPGLVVPVGTPPKEGDEGNPTDDELLEPAAPTPVSTTPKRD